MHNWTVKDESRANIAELIRNTLWTSMPDSYSDETILDYAQKIYDYVFVRYPIVAD